MSAFHRVDDMYAMDGPRFFRLAYRLPAYRGVMRMRLEADSARRDGGSPAAAGDGPAVSVPDTELRRAPEFAGLVEWGAG